MRIFITYEYFMPAYKAGGPVQSLDNMVRNMAGADMHMYIYCSNRDIDGEILTAVPHDKWVKYARNTQVYYSSGTKNASSVFELLTNIQPDIVFINGIFSYPFSIKPMLWEGGARKIVSARGMLHPGALSQKKTKKKIYLGIFKALKLQKKSAFHATTEEEAGFIKEAFGNDVKVWVAPNFPKVMEQQADVVKIARELKLLTVALISPMKNIKSIIEALANCKARITYNIYGPVKDAAYWAECQQLIQILPANIQVNYNGAIQPFEVSAVLAKHHCFIMPSKSENFGHAIYEALSAGKPVITSHFTPWNDLEESRAGINVDVDDITTITSAIDRIAGFDNTEYNIWANGANAYAQQKINIAAIRDTYNAMFKRV